MIGKLREGPSSFAGGGQHEIRHFYPCAWCSVVIAGFGRRAAIRLRGAGRRLYRVCPRSCRDRKRLPGLWRAGRHLLRAPSVTARLCTGLCAAGSGIQSTCIL
jgi:hypothetical protein